MSASYGQSRGRICLKRVPGLRTGQRNGSTCDKSQNLLQKRHDDPPSESGLGNGPIYILRALVPDVRFQSGNESQRPCCFVSGGKCLNIFTTPLSRFLMFLSVLLERVS